MERRNGVSAAAAARSPIGLMYPPPPGAVLATSLRDWTLRLVRRVTLYLVRGKILRVTEAVARNTVYEIADIVLCIHFGLCCLIKSCSTCQDLMLQLYTKMQINGCLKRRRIVPMFCTEIIILRNILWNSLLFLTSS